MALLWNPFENMFTVYQSVETPKVDIQLPILDEPIDMSRDFDEVREDGTMIAKSNLSRAIVNNTEEYEPVTTNVTLPVTTNVTLPSTTTQKSNKSLKSININSSLKERSNFVINSLMNRLNLTRELASGIAGVIMSESGLKPENYNKLEKAGRLPSSRANGAGYGAGMLQWSMGRKLSALNLLGKNAPIEQLSIEDLIEILARELEGPYNNTLIGIRSCKTPSEAAATMYCHNVGGYSLSNKPATKNEIDRINKMYSKFGNKAIVNSAMNFAESFFKNE